MGGRGINKSCGLSSRNLEMCQYFQYGLYEACIEEIMTPLCCQHDFSLSVLFPSANNKAICKITSMVSVALVFSTLPTL